MEGCGIQLIPQVLTFYELRCHEWQPVARTINHPVANKTHHSGMIDQGQGSDFTFSPLHPGPRDYFDNNIPSVGRVAPEHIALGAST
jgi:hypothetical protein